MASGLYDKGRQKFLEGAIQWLAHDIKAVLVDTNDYTHNIATNEFLSDISAGAIATSANLSGKTSTNGVADANDVTFTLVAGDQAEAVVLYRDTGVAGTSPLILFLDSAAVTGLPVTPSGGDITIRFDNGANKIFKL